MYSYFQNYLRTQLAATNDNKCYNYLPTTLMRQGVYSIDGKQIINLSNSGFMEWQSYAEVQKARAGVKIGCGVYSELERLIASWLGTEDCILYDSLGTAYSAITVHLLSRSDAIIHNQLCQFTLCGGNATANTVKYRFHDVDVVDIEKQLMLAQAQQNRLLIVDAVDAASGNIAPLERLTALSARYKAITVVDETYSLGLIGVGGSGICSLYDSQPEVEMHIGSLSAVVGCGCGAYIAGRAEIIDWLRQQPYSLSPSGSLSMVEAAAAIAAINRLQDNNTDRKYVTDIANYLIRQLYAIGLEVLPTQTPIVAVTIDTADEALRIARQLRRQGILVSCLVPPLTGKSGSRIVMHTSTALTEKHIEHITAMMQKIVAGR